MKVSNATNRMSKELTQLLAAKDARIAALEAVIAKFMAVTIQDDAHSTTWGAAFNLGIRRESSAGNARRG